MTIEQVSWIFLCAILGCIGIAIWRTMMSKPTSKLQPAERRRVIVAAVLLLMLIICIVMAVTTSIAHAASNDARVCWSAPTTNTDGSALTNLANYRVSFGKTRGGPYTQQVTVPASQTCSLIVPPSTGLWYFAVKAINSSGVESDFSAEGSKLIRPAAPTDGSIAAPTDGSVETRK